MVKLSHKHTPKPVERRVEAYIAAKVGPTPC